MGCRKIDEHAAAGGVPPEWNYLDGYYADSLARDARDQRNRDAEDKGYAPGGQEEPLAEQAMRMDPSMRMLVVHGRFDALPSSCASVEAQLSELDEQIRKRVQFRCVNSGHALFVNNDVVRNIVNAELRKLLR